MAINTYPNYSNFSAGVSFPAGMIGSWSENSNEDTNKAYFTINQVIPTGIYNAFASGTGSTLYWPSLATAVTQVTPGYSSASAGAAFQGLFYINTVSSSYQAALPTSWNVSQLNTGTTTTVKYLVSNGNIIVNGISLSTNPSSPVAAELRIYTTTNMTSWTQQTFFTGAVNPPMGANNAIWDGSYFLIADETSALKVSTNGVTWTTRATGFSNPNRSISYGGGYYLITFSTTNNTYIVSTNGINWTTRAQTGLPSVILNGMIYNSTSGQYVLYGASAGAIFSSTNLTNWTTRSIGGSAYQGSAVGGGFMSLLSISGWWAVSTDGIAWSTKGIAFNSGYGGIYDNGYHIYGINGNQSAVAFSSPVAATSYRQFNNLKWGNSGMIVKANGAYMSVDVAGSTNGWQFQWSTSLAGGIASNFSYYIESKSNTSYIAN